VSVVIDELVVDDQVDPGPEVDIADEYHLDEVLALRTDVLFLVDVGYFVLLDALAYLLAVLHVVHVEGRGALEQLEAENSYGPGVDLLSLLRVTGHLGGELVIGATEGPAVLHLPRVHCQALVHEAPAEVVDLDESVLEEQHVFGFEVAVDDSIELHELDDVGLLEDDLAHFVFAEE